MTISISPLTHDAPSLPDAGLGALRTPRGNLPLDAVDVSAAVTGLVASVEVTQVFHNPFDVPLEATYVFPLPDRAAVTALRMEADGHVVDATLRERSQARAAYDQAIAAGQRAAIAEEDRPDVFTMRVGNIVPGERVTVHLTLDQPLPYEDGAATFRFPLVVAPRYVPGVPLAGEPAGAGVEPDTDTTPDASRISPPVLLPGFPNPVRLSLAVDIDPAGLPVSGAESSLHVVTSAITGDRTRLLVQPGERLDRDFVLRLALDAPGDAVAASLTPDESGDEGTFTVTVVPASGAAATRPRDVVLVLDRSGSMGGWKMVAARRAAARIVDTLTGNDRFAVLSFDTVVERPPELGARLAPASDRNRFRAVEHLAGLTARGGTEMLGPLQEAVALLGEAAGRDRVLVLVTDGQVGNEDHILAGIAPSLAGMRVHTVGIDRAVNAGFLGRLASVGRGRFELVESEDTLDRAMDHIHRRIAAPTLVDVSLDWSGVEVDADTVVPARATALFPGVPLVVSGRYRDGGVAPGAKVTVRGRTADGAAWERTAEAAAPEASAATRVWARARLRELEDRYVVTPAPGLETQIVDTSLRFGVLCRFTAFVAVDSRVVTDGTGPHRVVQPVELPSGWELQAPQHVGIALPTGAVLAGGAPLEALRVGAGPVPPGGAPAPPPFLPAPAPPAGRPPSARPMRPSRPAPGADTTAASTHAVREDVRRRLAQEVGLLAEVVRAGATDGDRWAHLSDLRSRLAGMVAELAGAGEARERYAALADLVAALEVADGSSRWSADLVGLWSRTVEVLTAIVESGAAATGEPPAPGRRFWAR